METNTETINLRKKPRPIARPEQSNELKQITLITSRQNQP